MQSAIDEEALELELWRLAFVEYYVDGRRGAYAQLLGLAQHEVVEKYLEAYPARRRMRDRHVAAGTCKEGAYEVQEYRLALIAKQPKQKEVPKSEVPHVGDWMDDFIAPPVGVRFTAFTAVDQAPRAPLPAVPTKAAGTKREIHAEAARLLANNEVPPGRGSMTSLVEILAGTFSQPKETLRRYAQDAHSEWKVLQKSD